MTTNTSIIWPLVFRFRSIQRLVNRSPTTIISTFKPPYTNWQHYFIWKNVLHFRHLLNISINIYKYYILNWHCCGVWTGHFSHTVEILALSILSEIHFPKKILLHHQLHKYIHPGTKTQLLVKLYVKLTNHTLQCCSKYGCLQKDY